jgi:hypothetical protein
MYLIKNVFHNRVISTNLIKIITMSMNMHLFIIRQRFDHFFFLLRSNSSMYLKKWSSGRTNLGGGVGFIA